ncbi:MAG: oligosaccharide flippase family protein, partial [Candidatus Aminicenantes bacterium]|nr:oligosaccharide flippase family protein [Candidatus Aminicenantes bacterium]NIQ73034.1 oligosaccharide flippase family protein [Candidatus Aminicenantes bacterium]NIT29057.1 oligosaccharide flippase family protein [Candidatus Aminicenantes bacterium]
MGVICLRKELEFDKLFIFQLVGSVADFIVAVVGAILLRNVWALVYGKIAGSIAMLLMSYLIHPYRPKLKIDLVKTKELFLYGRWVLGTSILFF